VKCSPRQFVLIARDKDQLEGEMYTQSHAEIAHIYKTDRAKYDETAREWTRKFGADRPRSQLPCRICNEISFRCWAIFFCRNGPYYCRIGRAILLISSCLSLWKQTALIVSGGFQSCDCCTSAVLSKHAFFECSGLCAAGMGWGFAHTNMSEDCRWSDMAASCPKKNIRLPATVRSVLS
jgi:hypothetical protein